MVNSIYEIINNFLKYVFLNVKDSNVVQQLTEKMCHIIKQISIIQLYVCVSGLH